MLSGRDTAVPAPTNDDISLSVSTVDGVITLSTAGFLFICCVFYGCRLVGGSDRVGSGLAMVRLGLSVGRLGWWERLRNGLPIQPFRDCWVGQALCCVFVATSGYVCNATKIALLQ